ncbi:redox-regulated ATPase YchF [Candidatus Micrarchaeota archaeon]|nr:redox-regulated ATPase YchF [Candidatus Micrarchaeota archaeon]
MPVERSARPFTTIKPNRGVAYVEVECVDKEFGVQCNPRSGFCIDSRRFAPVEVLDVAGLVPGAHEGKGLGNKFLDDLRQADILIHIVDASGSTNENGEVVEQGSHDPCKDVAFLEEELNYWFEGIIKNNWPKLVRESKLNKKNEEVFFNQFTGLGIKKSAVQSALASLQLSDKTLEKWNEENKLGFASKLRELGKPIIIAANKCDLNAAQKNIQVLKQTFPNYLIIPCSAEAEITLKVSSKNNFIKYIPGDATFEVLKELNDSQKKAMNLLSKLLAKFNGTGVQKILNSAVFEYLKYIAVFPGGVNKLSDSEGRVLPDVFLLPPGSTALDFAFTLHTDMGKGFIKAVDVKQKKPIGKDHVLKHRDVVEIHFRKN